MFDVCLGGDTFDRVVTDENPTIISKTTDAPYTLIFFLNSCNIVVKSFLGLVTDWFQLSKKEIQVWKCKNVVSAMTYLHSDLEIVSKFHSHRNAAARPPYTLLKVFRERLAPVSSAILGIVSAILGVHRRSSQRRILYVVHSRKSAVLP